MKVALVSGSSRGIGLAVVQRLASDGMHVTATGRSKTHLEALKSELESGRIDTFAGDAIDSRILWLG